MAHTRPSRRARREGFTLVELIVVTAMMGIFALVFYGVFTFNVQSSRVQTQSCRSVGFRPCSRASARWWLRAFFSTLGPW